VIASVTLLCVYIHVPILAYNIILNDQIHKWYREMVCHAILDGNPM